MTLAEAIRKGAEQSQQVAGVLAYLDADGEVTHTCALGAAIHGGLGAAALKSAVRRATGGTSGLTELIEAFPVLTKFVKSPLVGAPAGLIQLLSVIMVANDSFGLTREQIADEVEVIEEGLS